MPARDLLGAKHDWQLARLMHNREMPGRVGAIANASPRLAVVEFAPCVNSRRSSFPGVSQERAERLALQRTGIPIGVGQR
jgi:hypothetical protein